MALRLNPAAIFNRLRSTYWFLPTLLTVTAVALGVTLTAIDRRYPDVTEWMGWAYGGGADGARSLLSAVAGSTVTVVSVTFSVLVVALTVASQHFGPRLLNSFMRDNAAQLVLGTFTGTFAYCVVVLRTVQGDGDGYAPFVPQLAVTAAVILSLVSVGLLIYYVHHIAVSLQVSEITAAVVRDMEGAVDRLYPDPIGAGTDPAARQPPPVPDNSITIGARASGYVQEVDSAAVLELAAGRKTTIWLLARPGDFVTDGGTLAAAHPPPADAGQFEAALAGVYRIGTDRTSDQDVGFAVQQLVEVALRALSPGVNEPFTAITCIDRLCQGLSKLARRSIPSAVRVDDNGAVRVVAAPVTFAMLVKDAFDQIALYADGNPAIFERLFRTLQHLALAARRPEDRDAIQRLADLVWSTAAKQVEHEVHRSTLARLSEDLRQALEGRPHAFARAVKAP